VSVRGQDIVSGEGVYRILAAPPSVPIIIHPDLQKHKYIAPFPRESKPDNLFPLEQLLDLQCAMVLDVATSAAGSKEDHMKLPAQPYTSSSDMIVSDDSQSESARLAYLWPQGSQLVKLRAAVVSRRRINKRLVFVDLVPVNTLLTHSNGGIPSRVCWKHPDDGTRCRCVHWSTILNSISCTLEC
jgi:hypothetical protein